MSPLESLLIGGFILLTICLIGIVLFNRYTLRRLQLLEANSKFHKQELKTLKREKEFRVTFDNLLKVNSLKNMMLHNKEEMENHVNMNDFFPDCNSAVCIAGWANILKPKGFISCQPNGIFSYSDWVETNFNSNKEQQHLITFLFSGEWAVHVKVNPYEDALERINYILHYQTIPEPFVFFSDWRQENGYK